MPGMVRGWSFSFTRAPDMGSLGQFLRKNHIERARVFRISGEDSEIFEHFLSTGFWNNTLIIWDEGSPRIEVTEKRFWKEFKQKSVGLQCELAFENDDVDKIYQAFKRKEQCSVLKFQNPLSIYKTDKIFCCRLSFPLLNPGLTSKMKLSDPDEVRDSILKDYYKWPKESLEQ